MTDFDMPDFSPLPPGQFRAVTALIGGGVARTYPEAAHIARMSEGTLLIHFNRVRQRHPELYAEIREVRKAQLAVRHREALAAARAHTTTWLRNKRRLRRLCGISLQAPNADTKVPCSLTLTDFPRSEAWQYRGKTLKEVGVGVQSRSAWFRVPMNSLIRHFKVSSVPRFSAALQTILA